MRGVGARLANNLWQVSCIPAWHRFHRAATSVEQTQRRILSRYLSTNRDTDYGRRFGFASISSERSFQETVPITTYEDYMESIEAIGQGRSNVLTAEPVTMFEITSGSTSVSKLIPYTRSLRAEFQRAVAAWIVDLFRCHPDLKRGPAYWSVTPLLEGHQTTSGGIPIGFEDDSAYLGMWGKLIADAALAVPNDVKALQDMDVFRYTTLHFLLRQADLRLISIWNPTFLSLLLARLPEWWRALLEDIAAGTLSPPGYLSQGNRQPLQQRLSPDPRRAHVLASVQPNDYRAIWPNLGLVSCWMDGPAASFAQALRDMFPGVLFQGKGLIATEAFVSFPMIDVSGCGLAVTSHFFEFLPVDSPGLSPTSVRPRLAHQLEEGQTYSVVVTTGGGLYRYHLHDVVKVVGHVAQVPCLRFLGKGDRVSDWFGEKLHAQFVADTLEELFREFVLSAAFAMLAPDDSDGRFRYTLYLELSPDQRPRSGLANLPTVLDQMLRRSFHYDYCRKLGQLAAPEVYWCGLGSGEAYLRACQARGQRLGDVKPTCLERTTGWGSCFSRADDRDAPP